MTREQRYAESKVVANKVAAISASSRVAGGYARDVFFGVVPKDIDIWCSQRNYRETERRENLVRRLGATFGQTLRRVTGADYPGGNEVWEMETTDGRFEPLNIIFVPNIPEAVVYEFDFDICMFILDRDSGIPIDFRHPNSREDGTRIMITPMSDVGRQLEHGLRIKAKYPGMRFMMHMNTMIRNLPLYMVFKNGGLFEERTNVPTQGEITLGDEVGQPIGAGAEQQAGGTTDIDNLVREQIAQRDAQERLRAWAATWTTTATATNWIN